MASKATNFSFPASASISHHLVPSTSFSTIPFDLPIVIFRAILRSDLTISRTSPNQQAKNVHYDPTSAPSGKCPHAKAARNAAALAQREVDVKAATSSSTIRATPLKASGTFSYGSFYEAELDKKHKDKSYRYFNNINRLAAKFPVAHTANTKDEVDVWCSNDYLGMGKNPIVLDTMK